jgi:hypothetical protein
MRQTLLEISDPIERLAEFVRLTIRHQPTPLNLAVAKRESLLLLTHPDEVVRAQAPMTELGRELIQAAVDSGHVDAGVGKHGLYSMMALKRSYNRARLLGDDFGLPLPTDDELVQHCLRALGITLPKS